jgi:N-acetylmuramidase
VLADLTGGGGATGHATTANDVIDLASVRGAVDRRCATIYNEMGQFIAAEAHRLGLSPAAVAALMIVESGGKAFGDRDRPIARFENHVFDRQWGTANAAVFAQHFQYNSWRGATHRFRELPTDPWLACHRNQTVEWQCIELAARLAGPEPALRSASFGAGQIMGFNHARVGFASATAMVEAFTASLRAQVTAILSFIGASTTLLAHAAAGQWLPIARAYNGGGQAAAYAAKIGSYHAAYGTVTRGMEHHVP